MVGAHATKLGTWCDSFRGEFRKKLEKAEEELLSQHCLSWLRARKRLAKWFICHPQKTCRHMALRKGLTVPFDTCPSWFISPFRSRELYSFCVLLLTSKQRASRVPAQIPGNLSELASSNLYKKNYFFAGLTSPWWALHSMSSSQSKLHTVLLIQYPHNLRYIPKSLILDLINQKHQTTWVFTNPCRKKKKTNTKKTPNKLGRLCPGNKKQSKASEIHVSNILEKDIQTMKCHCSEFFHEHHTDTALLTATKLTRSCLK